MNALVQWQPLSEMSAQGCNIRYGIAPDKLNQRWLVYGVQELDLCTLMAGQDCYLRVDVPMKSDPEWHFWMLFEDGDGCAETASWDMTQSEMAYVVSKIKAYLCSNGYLLAGGHYVSAGDLRTETKKETEKEELLRHLGRAVKLGMSAGVSDEEIIAAVKEAKEDPGCLRGLSAK